jgi:hypothetical protein
MITEIIGALIVKEKGLSFKQKYKLQCWCSTDAYRYVGYGCMCIDLIYKVDVSEEERRQIAFNTIKDLTTKECVQYVLEREFTFDIETL